MKLHQKKKPKHPISRRQFQAFLKQRTAFITQIKRDTGASLADKFQLHRWDYIIAGDGSATRLETPAGFGAILYSRQDDTQKKIFGGVSHATNNMAEMLAVFSALLYLEGIVSKGEKPMVYILSDSSYVVDSGNGTVTPKTNLALWSGFGHFKNKMNLIFIHVNRMLLPANVFGDRIGNFIRTSFETFTKLLHKYDKQTISTNDRR